MRFAGHITLSNGSWVPDGTVVLLHNLTLTTGGPISAVLPCLLLLRLEAEGCHEAVCSCCAHCWTLSSAWLLLVAACLLHGGQLSLEISLVSPSSWYQLCRSARDGARLWAAALCHCSRRNLQPQLCRHHSHQRWQPLCKLPTCGRQAAGIQVPGLMAKRVIGAKCLGECLPQAGPDGNLATAIKVLYASCWSWFKYRLMPHCEPWRSWLLQAHFEDCTLQYHSRPGTNCVQQTAQLLYQIQVVP